jgi:hypothetical protein
MAAGPVQFLNQSMKRQTRLVRSSKTDQTSGWDLKTGFARTPGCIAKFRWRLSFPSAMHGIASTSGITKSLGPTIIRRLNNERSNPENPWLSSSLASGVFPVES